MTVPAAVLGLLIALLVASLFHVWADGGAGRLILYSVLSVAGFVLGQWLASRQGWAIIMLGPLRLGFAVVGSLLFLILGHWLSLVQVERDHTSTKV